MSFPSQNPLGYMGINEKNPPELVRFFRAPATSDIHYELGTIWLDESGLRSYQLMAKTALSATWSILSPGSSDVDTINGLSPAAGNIVIAGGTNLTDVNGGNTVTLNLDPAITLATSVTAPTFASAAAMAINPVGALTVTGGGAIDVNVAAGSNLTLQLGDAAGANVLDIEDSASATVASIDSNGIATFVGMDGVLGGVTPAAATATTVTANTSVTSPLYTAAAADAVVRAGGANDVVLRLGDAAGATFLRVQDSTTADVFTIDSNGAIGNLLGATVVGAFSQTAGTFAVGQDNAADAIDIGGGNVARAITLGSTGAHTVNIGNALAGAIAIDSAANISLDGATASNFTVTGASQDLTLASVGGSIGIAASESAGDAIIINASGAAGGLQLQAGTGGVLIGNQADCTTLALGDFAPTADRTITIGGGTVVTAAVDDVIDIGVDGATTNADSTKTVNINTGGVTLGVLATNVMTGNVTSGTHTTSIATGNRAAGTMATNVMTGTGTKTFNLGNADALTTCNIDAITLINDGVNAATSINTGASTGTVSIGNGASGAITVAGGAAVTVDAVGVLELNSSAGVIGIGNDAVAQNINVGTGAAARTITIGNNNGATSVVVDSGTGAASFGATATVHTTTVGSTTGGSATVIQSGTGDITVTGTVKEIDAEFLYASGDDIVFQSNPLCQIATSFAIPTGATGELDRLYFQEGVAMEQFILGAGQTILAPYMDANGMLASLDLTATEGAEYNFGAVRTNSRHAFTIGTSAAFMFQLRFRINDMDGAAPYVFGFRKSEANNATFANYTDYATIGMIAASSVNSIVTATELNAGGQTVTNTTDLWGGDGTTNTLTVLVDAAGAVTYLINGVAPTVAAAFTFDNGDVVVPFIRITHSASPTEVNLVSMKIGYQA